MGTMDCTPIHILATGWSHSFAGCRHQSDGAKQTRNLFVLFLITACESTTVSAKDFERTHTQDRPCSPASTLATLALGPLASLPGPSQQF